MTGRTVTRRAVVVGLAALAGCAGSPDTGTTDDGRSPTTGRTDTDTDASPRTDTGDTMSPTDDRRDAATGTGTDPETTTRGALDLREANVTGVDRDGDPGGDVRFEVTLYHDDDGEPGYANWWQVESLDGERLGRRDLLHAHGTREFTRSSTVAVPANVACVVVRGHDETHGYGGQAAVVDLGSGDTRLVRQGSDPSSFSRADCP